MIKNVYVTGSQNIARKTESLISFSRLTASYEVYYVIIVV